MIMTRMKKSLSLILCMVLIAAMALFAAGCGNSGDAEVSSPSDVATSIPADGSVLGEGEKQFTFTVVDIDGNEVSYEIHTDADTVGDALLSLGIISGEAGAYGLYVKTVAGITADYDKDKTYWAFYVNGEYALTGVDQTPIQADTAYLLKAEAA